MSLKPANEDISEELLSLLGSGQQVEPLSKRYPGFDLADAYAISARVKDLRIDRGAEPIGRKIGFTNRSIWESQGIAAPMWNYVFDQTLVHVMGGLGTVELDDMPEPRIEPEVVLHLALAPEPGMTADELASCVDWAAPGFEVVSSVFPNWAFTVADAAAAFGLHAALFVGERLDLTSARPEQTAALSTFTVTLEGGDAIRRDGHAKNVLGGPLESLRFLVEVLARYPDSEPLKAGELITTGTLTEAMPIHPGETWSVNFDGIDFKPLRLRMA